jgi:aspartate kinase
VTDRVAVLKIGGSILTGPSDYHRAGSLIARRLHERAGGRIVVVVSAEAGATDSLFAMARSIVEEPEPAALDLLWSTGELRSVALVALSLQAQGIPAAAIDVHQAGLDCLRRSGPGVTVNPLRLRARLADRDVVVVPGFLARGVGDEVVSLGRGGSDLTAVLLAAALGARQCELVKDVAGCYTADPKRDPDAQLIPRLPFARALEMADAGCEVVQRAALEAARDHGIELLIAGLDGRVQTRIGSAPDPSDSSFNSSSFRKDIDNGVLHADHSRRPALGTGDRFADRADLSDLDLRAGSAGCAPGV